MAAQLSKRETEVLRLLADGLNRYEVADRMFVCRSTVKAHAEHATRKLGARSAMHAAVIAVRQGLIP